MIFRINLATRVYINTGLLRVCTLAAVLLLAALLFANVSGVASKVGEAKSMERQIAAMDEKFRTANKGMTQKDYGALLARISFANGIIEKKKYDWLDLFNRLELVVPDGVAVTSLEPDPKTQVLKLVGVARSFKNLRLFLEHLEESKYFTDVYLLSQTEAKFANVPPGANAPAGISFNLSCKVAGK